MAVEEYILEKMNFAKQERPTTLVTRSAPRFDEAEIISRLSRTRFVYIIDFSEPSNRLPVEPESRFENLEAGRVAAPTLPSIGQMDRFEESLYWLLSAATLIYLLFMIVTA
jgi:hypothetical protein